MKKWIIIVAILLVAIGGGFALAASGLIFGKAESNPQVTAVEAKEAALALFKGKIVSFEYDGDDLIPHYEIEITADKEKVEVHVNAKTKAARIVDREKFKNTASLSKDKAVEIAKANYDGELYKIQLDNEHGRLIYDVELRAALEKAEFEIDAETGEILSFETEPLKGNGSQSSAASDQKNDLQKTTIQKPSKSSSTQNTIVHKPVNGEVGISLDQAKEIALSKASGTVVKAKYDQDDNVYEIEIVNGKMEYEFEIHPQTGAIISYEEELIK